MYTILIKRYTAVAENEPRVPARKSESRKAKHNVWNDIRNKAAETVRAVLLYTANSTVYSYIVESCVWAAAGHGQADAYNARRKVYDSIGHRASGVVSCICIKPCPHPLCRLLQTALWTPEFPAQL